MQLNEKKIKKIVSLHFSTLLRNIIYQKLDNIKSKVIPTIILKKLKVTEL